jgi:hypothetical protein
MTATCRVLLAAALAIFPMLFPVSAQAACQDGAVSSCQRNGCTGVRECVGGRFLGCEVAPQCVGTPPPPKDKIHVDTLVPGTEVGILFDGANAQGSFNDRSLVLPAAGTSVTTSIANLTAPAFGNSVIVFGQSRQPRMWPAIWTNGVNTVTVPLDNNLRFNVTFWILSGPFATQQTRAAAAVLGVNNSYVAEKAGVRIAFVTIMDATANPAAPGLLAGGSMTAFQTQIGFNAREINFYVIDTVSGSANRGANFDGTPVIMLGQNALNFPNLLEHEMGHAFVLWHTGGLPGFDSQNVMQPVVAAHFLTEGQIFRMHFHPSSQLNGFGQRATQPTVICAEPMTNECPANNRRLWADGSMPPN